MQEAEDRVKNDKSGRRKEMARQNVMNKWLKTKQGFADPTKR